MEQVETKGVTGAILKAWIVAGITHDRQNEFPRISRTVVGKCLIFIII